MYLYVEKGGKEADEREESVATEIKKESHVDEIEERKQDVEKKPKAIIENENTFLVFNVFLLTVSLRFNKDLLIYM